MSGSKQHLLLQLTNSTVWSTSFVPSWPHGSTDLVRGPYKHYKYIKRILDKYVLKNNSYNSYSVLN